MGSGEREFEILSLNSTNRSRALRTQKFQTFRRLKSGKLDILEYSRDPKYGPLKNGNMNMEYLVSAIWQTPADID